MCAGSPCTAMSIESVEAVVSENAVGPFAHSSCTVAGSGAPVDVPFLAVASVVETLSEVGNPEVKAGVIGGENVDSSCTVVGSGAPVDFPFLVVANVFETLSEVGNPEVKAGAIGGENVDTSCTEAGSGAPVVGPSIVVANFDETCPEVGNSEVKAGTSGGECVDEATCLDSSCTFGGSGAPEVAGPSVTHCVSGRSNPPVSAVKVGGNFPGEILEFGFAAESTFGERMRSEPMFGERARLRRCRRALHDPG
jgi:hypothetical protein